jgi:hypothetical protein
METAKQWLQANPQLATAAGVFVVLYVVVLIVSPACVLDTVEGPAGVGITSVNHRSVAILAGLGTLLWYAWPQIMTWLRAYLA